MAGAKKIKSDADFETSKAMTIIGAALIEKHISRGTKKRKGTQERIRVPLENP
jgi:hypothetical protein